MQNRVVWFVAAVLFATSGSVAASRCVLPVADGGDIEPSPPQLVGRIVKVVPGQLLVRRAGATDTVRVLVAPSTDLFTVYGGGFEADELRLGQHILIWVKDCRAPKHGAPIAAVLQVCSLAPEPCPR